MPVDLGSSTRRGDASLTREVCELGNALVELTLTAVVGTGVGPLEVAAKEPGSPGSPGSMRWAPKEDPPGFMTWAPATNEVDRTISRQAGGLLRTSTPPTLNLLLLPRILRASV